jgi:hypothetical protein
VAADEVKRAQIIVTALDQTIASLRERRELEWEEQIETLTRMRQETIARVREIDPTAEFPE